LQLLEIIIGYFNTDTTGILVTGIPGVGKSFFAAFLLMHYLKQAVTIVYEDAKRGGRWLIIPGAPVQEGGLQDFTTELNLTTTLYICDVGGENSPEPVVCNALTVVLSSPDPAHYQEWLKEDDVTLYMPVWSAEEVTAVVPTVYPQRTLADGVTSIYPGRLNLYGGIARNIFRAQTDDKLERKLEKRIKACNLVKLYKSIEAGERIKSLKLLQYVLGTKPDGTPDFEDATLDFASDEICERVMKQKETHHTNEVVSFLSSSAGNPDVATMRGKAFEHYAHRVLAAGGEFRMRWENDPNHTDHLVHFPKSTQKGIVASLATLTAEVRQEGQCWDRKQQHIMGDCDSVLHSFCSCRCFHQEYARLLKKNFPTIDAARFKKLLFQMTVSPSHSVNLAGLKKAMTELGLIGGAGPDELCILFFAVPPDVFPVYQHKPGAMVPSGSVLPRNVALAVLDKPDDSRTDLAFGKYLLHVLRMMLSDFLPHTCGTMLLIHELVYYKYTNFALV
jgi:hypothetical protein